MPWLGLAWPVTSSLTPTPATTPNTHTHQGGFSYNGAGVSVWVGCPLAMFWATFAFYGLGGVASHGAGIIVWVGNPIFMPMAVSYFAGLGMVMFVGGGSAVLVGSPVAMPSALMVRQSVSHFRESRAV